MQPVRLEAVENMLAAFVQSPNERRVSIYVKRTEEYPVDVLQRACVRIVESCDRTPTVARLRAVCGEIQGDADARQANRDDARDWIDEALDNGMRWWDRKKDTSGVEHYAPEHRAGWRRWANERIVDGWSEHEVVQVISGARAHDWAPPEDMLARRTRVQRFLAAVSAARGLRPLDSRERDARIRRVEDILLSDYPSEESRRGEKEPQERD